MMSVALYRDGKDITYLDRSVVCVNEFTRVQIGELDITLNGMEVMARELLGNLRNKIPFYRSQGARITLTNRKSSKSIKDNSMDELLVLMELSPSHDQRVEAACTMADLLWAPVVH